MIIFCAYKSKNSRIANDPTMPSFVGILRSIVCSSNFFITDCVSSLCFRAMRTAWTTWRTKSPSLKRINLSFFNCCRLVAFRYICNIFLQTSSVTNYSSNLSYSVTLLLFASSNCSASFTILI